VFGDQLKFGDGIDTKLECAHPTVEKTKAFAVQQAVRILCPDCNQWVVPERGGELVQTSSEESTNGSDAG
jgi:hypothetical protein